MSFAKDFRVEPGSHIDLSKHDPKNMAPFVDKELTKQQTQSDSEAIDALQNILYAEGQRSLLVVLQGIDCSGKDGTVRAVFNHCGPIGVMNTSYKAPTPDELGHDYLWRVHKSCPPRGMIGIFNRSHYEDVLVAKVKTLASSDVIEQRYEQINHFEKLLGETGTKILKFMLNISKEEQAVRLKDRVDDPTKRWKFNPGDLADRALWDDYMKAYEVALNRCSTQHAPWHIIPSDHNWVRNGAIARIVREALEQMDPKFPEPKGWDPATVQIV